MTFFVFIVVLVSATVHAGWNCAAKRAAEHMGALGLGLCLAAVLSWPWALLVYQSERLTLAGLPSMVATGLRHAGYFSVLVRAYAVGELSLVYPVARGTGVAGTAIVAAAWLQESLSLPGRVGIAAIGAGTATVQADIARRRRLSREGSTCPPRRGVYALHLISLFVL